MSNHVERSTSWGNSWFHFSFSFYWKPWLSFHSHWVCSDWRHGTHFSCLSSHSSFHSLWLFSNCAKRYEKKRLSTFMFRNLIIFLNFIACCWQSYPSNCTCSCPLWTCRSKLLRWLYPKWRRSKFSLQCLCLSKIYQKSCRRWNSHVKKFND